MTPNTSINALIANCILQKQRIQDTSVQVTLMYM